MLKDDFYTSGWQFQNKTIDDERGMMQYFALDCDSLLILFIVYLPLHF